MIRTACRLGAIFAAAAALSALFAAYADPRMRALLDGLPLCG